MPASAYQAEIARLQALALQALREHAAPPAVAQALLAAAFPAAVTLAAGEFAGFEPLPAGAEEQLTNALHAAAGQLVADAQASGAGVMEYRLAGGAGAAAADQGAVAQLLDAVFWLAEQRTPPVDAGLPAQLLEQVTEGASNADCEGVFAYLDSRTATFKTPAFEGRSKLTLLRTCNMLLKRLSKSANALLCGRVLLFLAKFLPLTERSGVNLTGTFNTANVTPVEDVQEGAVDSEGKPVDVAFYRTFWGLQSYFSNPPAALAGGKWGEISRDIRRVLERFRQEKVTVGEAAAGGGAGGAAAADGQGTSVKYLSSSRLMGLQLRDATFRRHFLLQCLILMQWCERPRQKDKAALRSKLLDDLQDLRSKVFAELEATPDKGREFAAAIRHLMQWEDAWAAWKQAGCPVAPLERPPAEPPAAAADADLVAPAPKRRKMSSDAVFGIRVGTAELDRLWNLTEDNLSALSADDRGGFKSVRQLMEPVMEEMQEAAAAGDDDGLLARLSRSKLYSWKALRAVARANLQAFAAAVQKGGDLEVAARAMYPAECPPPPPPAPAAAPPAAAAAAAAAQPADSVAAPAAAAGDGAAEAAAEEAGGAASPAHGDAAGEEGAAAADMAGSEGSDEEGQLPEEAAGASDAEEGGVLDEAEAEEGEQQQEAGGDGDGNDSSSSEPTATAMDADVAAA